MTEPDRRARVDGGLRIIGAGYQPVVSCHPHYDSTADRRVLSFQATGRMSAREFRWDAGPKGRKWRTDANPEPQRFAQLLTQRVRDQAISECDRLAGRSVRGPSGKRWQEVIERESRQRTLSELVPTIVDQTLVRLFDTIDDGALPLQRQSEDGTIESLRELGRDEMAGWLVGGRLAARILQGTAT